MKVFDNVVAGYRVADVDDLSNPKYYGFTAKGGAWYIIKEDTSDWSFRYCSGKTSYSTNWTNRASLTYVYFHQSV
jgi:hypothetical protein